MSGLPAPHELDPSTPPVVGGIDSAICAFDLVSAPIWLFDLQENRIIWANVAALEFWHSPSLDELRARDFSPVSRSTKERLKDYTASFEQGIARREIWTFYPGDVAITARCICRPIQVEGYEKAMLVEVQQRDFDYLPDNELRSIEALRHTSLKVSLFSLKGRLLFRNPAASAAFAEFDKGFAPDADRYSAMFLWPAEAEELLAAASNVQTAEAVVAMALPGQPYHRVQAIRVIDPATGERAILVIQQNVTHSLRIGQQLVASRDSLQSVITHAPIPIIILSAQTRETLFLNMPARQLMPLPNDAFMPTGVDQIFCNPAEFEEALATLAEEEFHSRQIEIRSRNGRCFWAWMSLSSVEYYGAAAYAIALSDIDQLAMTARDLKGALEMERRISATQREFLAFTSHELRTPLAVIDSAAQRLEKNAAKMQDDLVVERSRQIRNAVKRLSRIMDSSLEQADLANAHFKYQPHETDIAALLLSIRANQMELTPDREIRLLIGHKTNGTIPPLHIDPALFERAITNLLSNAVKYSPVDQPISISADIEDGWLAIRVQDRGSGIPPQDREHIFTPFYRASNTLNTHGTGLGLSIVRHIVTLHRGSVILEENDANAGDGAGEGTTFLITIPLL